MINFIKSLFKGNSKKEVNPEKAPCSDKGSDGVYGSEKCKF